MAADEPLRTVCAGVKGGHFSAVTPILAGVGGRAGQSEPRSGGEPLYTTNTKADTALVAPHLVKFRGDSIGTPVTEPVPTITSGAGAARPAGAAHALGVATAFLEQASGGFYEGGGRDARAPMSTITSSGSQQQLVTTDLAVLSPEQEAGALRVTAFLVKYYGTGANVPTLREPLDTVTTRDRMALVTVVIKGTPYVIVDIGLRMLKPHELFRAQGFPKDYVIDRTANGTPLSISAAVRMVGNSVSPPPIAALARANLYKVKAPRRIAA